MGGFHLWRKSMPRIQNKKIQKSYPNKLYYFICEDEKSMLYYLDGLKKKYKGKAVIQYQKANKGTDVNSIKKHTKEKWTEINNEKDAYPKGFKIIACFDKDDNNINDIKRTITDFDKKPSLGTIYNNPCYEYWLMLHIESINKEFLNSKQCERECMEKINKHYKQSFVDLDKFKSFKNIFNIVGKDIEKAINNSKKINFIGYNNTFTNAHSVFEEIIKMK